jgi:hypothetical protein
MVTTIAAADARCCVRMSVAGMSTPTAMSATIRIRMRRL